MSFTLEKSYDDVFKKYNEILNIIKNNGLIGDDFHFELVHDDKYVAT